MIMIGSNKKSFLLHIDSLDILDDLSDQEVANLFRAIKSHQNNEPIELDKITKMAFLPFKNQFLRDDEKYKETCKKRAESGRLGAEAKAAKAAEANKNSKYNQKEASARKSQQVLDIEANQADNKNKNKNKNKSDLKDLSARADEKLLIYNYWKEVFKKTAQARFTPKRVKRVRERLADGYTVEELKTAIYGCSITPHNMGVNPHNKPFDCLELIMRTGEQVERFINNANQSSTPQMSLAVQQTLEAGNRQAPNYEEYSNEQPNRLE